MAVWQVNSKMAGHLSKLPGLQAVIFIPNTHYYINIIMYMYDQ